MCASLTLDRCCWVAGHKVLRVQSNVKTHQDIKGDTLQTINGRKDCRSTRASADHGLCQKPNCFSACNTRTRIVSDFIGNARQKSSRLSVAFRWRTFAAQ
jgi:hypothetical protein